MEPSHRIADEELLTALNALSLARWFRSEYKVGLQIAMKSNLAAEVGQDVDPINAKADLVTTGYSLA